MSQQDKVSVDLPKDNVIRLETVDLRSGLT
jgi:hypothetical protein